MMHRYEAKASVTPESWLSGNIRKTYKNTFVASALLAYGKSSQEAPKNIRDVTNQLIDNFNVFYFWNIDWKVFFLGILSIHCNIRRDRPTDTGRWTGRSRWTCWPPLIYDHAWCRFLRCDFREPVESHCADSSFF